ncbi:MULTISPECIES: hypothetical protein [Bacillus]|uniref:hypothetical protein n=1 Tax=Bacillus TaxID=1386 RepID=UPI000992C034|nr:hypothetical protein [Bacillus mycoides]OOR61423.1 hypothetical protein BLX04_19330 [Bacillus mycoides]
MRSKKNALKEWKADVQVMREERRLEKKVRKKNKKYSIPGHTADFMNGSNTINNTKKTAPQRCIFAELEM